MICDRGSLRPFNAVDLLEELVNLPDGAKTHQVTQFIEKYYKLERGQIGSDGQKITPMLRNEVIRLSGLFRLFWKPRFEHLKSKIFMETVQRIVWISSKRRDGAQLARMGESALRLDWKSGRFVIAARSPMDCLAHIVFRNRNRLRACTNCKRLFVASSSKGSLCSASCKQDGGRGRRRKWWNENRSAAIVNASS